MKKPSTPTGQIAKRKANRTSFKKGDLRTSAASHQHGLYSDQHPVAERILVEVDRYMSAQYVDEGEELANIPARRRKLIEYSGRILHKNILKLALAIEERGLFDGHGKLRVAWISKLESLINSAARIDNLLGLERRAKDVLDLPLDQYVASQTTDIQTNNTEGGGGRSDTKPDADAEQTGRPSADPDN